MYSSLAIRASRLVINETGFLCKLICFPPGILSQEIRLSNAWLQRRSINNPLVLYETSSQLHFASQTPYQTKARAQKQYYFIPTHTIALPFGEICIRGHLGSP